MTRLLLSAAVLACVPGVIQAEFPGLCVPGSSAKRVCSPFFGQRLKQLCPPTCAPQWGVRREGLSCLTKQSPCSPATSCPLKSPCPLKGQTCDPCQQGVPGQSRFGCLTRARDGLCRLIPRRVKSVCRSVCRPSCGKDPCCDIDRVVIHFQPCCQPSVCQQRVVTMPQVQTCGSRPVCGVPSTHGGVLVVPDPAPVETTQSQLDERLRRLEAEVSSLASQVQSQNERIGRR
jgi:hypothetical protein